ncbi:MAG TPA: COX15/CtaA family protein [Xanthobacteraceae bacterium]
MAVAEILIRSSAVVSSDAASAEPAHIEALAVRAYFLVLALLGLAAFALGIENRLTPALFAIAPPVDLVPPLGEQAWYAAFVLHQQDPVFSACGGAESLAQFKLLYWWEWLRRGSVLLLGGVLASGFFAAAVVPEYRIALRRLAGLALIGAAYLAAVLLLDLAAARVEDLMRYNVGQYRHALDVTFLSVAIALALAAAIVPRAHPFGRASWVWIALIVLDICSGALFAARDAGSVWRSFPGYETGLFPPLGRLTAYAPLWLNLTFNQYTIQFVHRVLSIGLWMALIANMIWNGRRDLRALARPAALFVLVTAEMAAGIATLLLGASAAAAFLHEVGAIVLLAVAFVFLASPRRAP